MNIIIETVNGESHEETNALIKRKLQKLGHFFEKIVYVFVYLKELNISEKDNKCIEVRIGVPGEDIIVKKCAPSYKKAIDIVMVTLKRSIKKKKDKIKHR